MKTLHLALIAIAGIAPLVGVGVYIGSNPIIANTTQTGNHMESLQAPTPEGNSTVVIPYGVEDASLGLGYEPKVIVTVLGTNNTVLWENKARVANYIAADGRDDPQFWNFTHPLHGGAIMPGNSSSFTFAMPGDFGYHGKVFPWLHGRVLVLPPTSENALRQVVLNDSSGIPNPCGVFLIPCPSNPSHTFAAQRLGANIYIEKFTGNGVDYYAIIHNGTVCTFSTNFGGSCRDADDLAILRFIGVDTTVTRQHSDIYIAGPSRYTVGKPIRFEVRVSGYGPCDFPSVTITHGGTTVWRSKSGTVSCPSPMVRLDEVWDTGRLGGPFSINQTGTYTIRAGYDSNYTESIFEVVSTIGQQANPATNGQKNAGPAPSVDLHIVPRVPYTNYGFTMDATVNNTTPNPIYMSARYALSAAVDRNAILDHWEGCVGADAMVPVRPGHSMNWTLSQACSVFLAVSPGQSRATVQLTWMTQDKREHSANFTKGFTILSSTGANQTVLNGVLGQESPHYDTTASYLASGAYSLASVFPLYSLGDHVKVARGGKINDTLVASLAPVMGLGPHVIRLSSLEMDDSDTTMGQGLNATISLIPSQVLVYPGQFQEMNMTVHIPHGWPDSAVGRHISYTATFGIVGEEGVHDRSFEINPVNFYVIVTK